ncbi:TraA family conjugative transfer protein [Thiorhodovibrio frisius]|uniref:TrbC/VIRB2 family protein n=2 Tax=Thiorhodovibrio frisius TaxID=631362 RepID=H8YWG9_9GAMM|nr:TraA family conjugative transfer protein [Thiorhodovibrio frisius]EIC22795.1 TrbC/VIRB2 family protein [Thiorhodovibrio frisius]EIC24014.1 TrbC/VIRB2 family protein [Thiorhodovibrio frisius]WPL22946.1 Type IV secretory pathway, VirB2 components (pilins) [Thiorhodovibrio frisius]WPL23086.1 Type IV secretory pathway, VirB2 components (pilins) [Thiorhodovibrio frisius]
MTKVANQNQTQTATPSLSSRPLLHAALLGAPLLVLLLPDTALAGAGGTEFQATYDMLIGWMTGLLGRIIAVAFIIVGLIAGVARQSIMSFAIGIAAGLGLFMAPDIVDAVVSATLPIV